MTSKDILIENLLSKGVSRVIDRENLKRRLLS